MKVLKNITRVLFVAALIGGISVDASAQKKEKKAKKEKAAKELKRPDKVGHGATDTYVTSAFDYMKKIKLYLKKWLT